VFNKRKNYINYIIETSNSNLIFFFNQKKLFYFRAYESVKKNIPAHFILINTSNGYFFAGQPISNETQQTTNLKQEQKLSSISLSSER